MKKMFLSLSVIMLLVFITMTNAHAEGLIQLNPTDSYILISDGPYYYSQAFQKWSNYDYLQLYVEEINKNSVRFCLEKKENGHWKSINECDNGNAFPNYYLDNDGGDGTYIMYCGDSTTNYVTPPNVSTSHIKSVLAGDLYAIEAGEIYRIVLYNPSQWNGKTAEVKCSIEFMNWLGD